MISQCTKFEVSRFTRYEAMNGGAKCRNWGGLGWLGVTQGQPQGLWRQKTRLPRLSCGVVCVILSLAVFVEHRLVTDTDTDTDRHRPMASNAHAGCIARL